VNAKDILNRGMLTAMEVIGGRFRDGTVFIPEVLLSARAMNEALAVLEPYLAKEKKDASGKVLIGTVRGDLHDIGKNMVATMLRGVGFDVVDLGINITADDFVAQVEKHRPDILGMSALLTTTMPEMKKVIDLLAARGLRGEVKIMVGGAPVNEKFARDIGADGYGADAGSTVDLAKTLLRR
jgi:5-methyltetrahydrofolate--homocysteine methyltransferase